MCLMQCTGGCRVKFARQSKSKWFKKEASCKRTYVNDIEYEGKVIIIEWLKKIFELFSISNEYYHHWTVFNIDRI